MRDLFGEPVGYTNVDASVTEQEKMLEESARDFQGATSAYSRIQRNTEQAIENDFDRKLKDRLSQPCTPADLA